MKPSQHLGTPLCVYSHIRGYKVVSYETMIQNFNNIYIYILNVFDYIYNLYTIIQNVLFLNII